jgi:hypothetical protein
MSGSTTALNWNLPRLLRIAALLFFLVLEGCATGRSSSPFDEATNLELYRLRVESRNTYEVSVYVNSSGRRQLLGTVSGNGLEYFEFEYPAARVLYIELESQLGDRYRVPPPPVTMVGRLELFIQSELRRSAFRG